MFYWIIIIILIILFACSAGLCVFLLKRQGTLKRQLQQSYDYKRVSRKIIAKLTEDPKFLEEYLRENSYRKIAIYGNNEYTDLIIDLLKQTEIEVAYVIASQWSVSAKGVKLVKKGEDKVDATIVVTENNKSSLDGDYQGEYLSFYDLLYNKN